MEWELSATVHLPQLNVLPRPTVLTSLQEDCRKIKGPEPQEAIFRARSTEGWGHTDAVDCDAWTWDRHTHTIWCPPRQVFSLYPALCLELLSNKHFPTDFRHTCVKSPFLPAVCMLLLRRQQPPDIPNNNSAVVDLKDMATPAASKSTVKTKQPFYR